MNSHKISIIVPVYNLDKYIEATIESLLNQTYKNIEIILVDDGSTDNSPKICDRLAKENSCIKVIHQQRSGVSVARNKGVEVSTGDYIGFCDGDDLADSDMYEFMYNLAIKDDADISICELRFILEDGTKKNIATGKYKVWENTPDFLIDFFSGEVKMSVDTKLFKREVCEKIQFPIDAKTNEDKYYCFLAAINSNRISSKNEAKYTYCRRKGSSSVTEFSPKYYDCITLAQKMLSTTEELYPQLADRAKCNMLATVLRIYKLMYTRNGLSKYKDDAKKMIAYVKSFDSKVAKKYLSKKNYVRYRALKISNLLFLFMTQFFDRK